MIAIDLDTGARTVLTDPNTPDEENQILTPAGIYIDAANNRALVGDQGRDAIIAVDLTTGARTIFSDADNGVGTRLSLTVDLAPSTTPGRVWVLDQAINAVIELADTDGDRTVLSR